MKDRFLAKVQIDDASGCWLWTGSIDRKGYGRFSVGGVNATAHRVSHGLFVGPIPEGLTIDHLCRVRHCVNPEHLEPVTAAENTARGFAARPARTHCSRGHELSGDNAYTRSDGGVGCRTCARAYQREYEERQRRLRGVPARGEATHCKRGHLFDARNAIVDKHGKRRCRTCRDASIKAWKAAKKAERCAL